MSPVITAFQTRPGEQNCIALSGAHSHISDCHVFIRCNSTDPFIVNCSQRLALGMKTIWFILLDELVRAELVRHEAVRGTWTKTKGWTPAANDLWPLPDLLPLSFFYYLQSGAEKYLQIIHSTCLNPYGESDECETTAGWKSKNGKDDCKSTLTQAFWNSPLARCVAVCIKLHLFGTEVD